MKQKNFHLISCFIRTWNLFSDPKRSSLRGGVEHSVEGDVRKCYSKCKGGCLTPQITVFLQKLTRPLQLVSSPPLTLCSSPCPHQHTFAPVLSNTHSFYTLLLFFKNHYAFLHIFHNQFNIISPLLLDLSNRLFPSGVITEALDAVFFYACNMSCPSHPQFFHLYLRPLRLSEHFVLQHHQPCDLLWM